MKPDFNVISVIEEPGKEKAQFQKIGVGFKGKQEGEINLILNALPVGRKLLIRKNEQKEQFPA